jgi:hypothetical protein
MNNPDHISESLETIFLVKIIKFFDADPGSDIRDGKNSDLGSGMEKSRILDPGSGINIPDSQHCLQTTKIIDTQSVSTVPHYLTILGSNRYAINFSYLYTVQTCKVA